MRALVFALALIVVPAQAQTSVCGTNAPVVATKWQEYAKTINQQTACIHELQARIVSLERKLPIIARVYNDIIAFGRDQACRWNAKVGGWLGSLPGIEPTPLGGYVCPSPMPTQTAPVPTPIIFSE